MLKTFGMALSSALVFFVVGASCGGTKNPCVERNVSCNTPLSCDPADGVCKCGGRGGVICGEGFVCDADTNTCQSKKCAAVDCNDAVGTSCDVNDGQCKCGGTGGVVCSASEVCSPNAKACVAAVNCNQVACARNQTCEQSSGKCKCATAECSLVQSCVIASAGDRMCVNDNCSGVSCTGTNVCDSADGLCKCGGVLCQSGEACACPAGSDGGCADNTRTCRAGNACANVTCAAGQTCDPSDGVCRCGGPGGPACASNQICNLGPPAQCQGGQQCLTADGGAKTCAGGTSCDPEDGRCKCGGRGGLLCAPAGGFDGGAGTLAQICVQNPVQQACRVPCDVRNPDCSAGTYCYFDSSASTPAAYCAVATDNKGDEDPCNTSTSCFSTSPNARSGHCLGLALGSTGICHAYCDVMTGAAGCTQVPKAQNCIQIPNAPTNYGYCNPI